MLKKLLFQQQDKKQLFIAMIGAFLGITFLITSIHYLVKINKFGKGADILGPNTIIVQKKVGNSNTLGISKTDFTLKEIEKIKAEPFIKDAKPVISNNFDISLRTDDPMVPYFRTDVFVQTIDESFLDVDLKNWTWKEGDDFVPIIMPREFLVMLNTFMSAQGIPQVSDDLAKQIQFEFWLSNKDNSKKEDIKARIVGFTNSVSSLLVPKSFMEYGNKKFSDGKPQKITQIMISGEESEFGLVEQLLQKRGLETKNAQMVIGRLKSIVGTLFMVVLGVSIVAVFLSGLVLIQYMQLLISKNAYAVKTLLRIGYHPKDITRLFFLYFIKIFGIITVIGFVLFILLKFFIDKMFISGGLYIDTDITLISILALLIAYGLFAFSSFQTAKKGVFKKY